MPGAWALSTDFRPVTRGIARGSGASARSRANGLRPDPRAACRKGCNGRSPSRPVVPVPGLASPVQRSTGTAMSASRKPHGRASATQSPISGPRSRRPQTCPVHGRRRDGDHLRDALERGDGHRARQSVPGAIESEDARAGGGCPGGVGEEEARPGRTVHEDDGPSRIAPLAPPAGRKRGQSLAQHSTAGISPCSCGRARRSADEPCRRRRCRPASGCSTAGSRPRPPRSPLRRSRPACRPRIRARPGPSGAG